MTMMLLLACTGGDGKETGETGETGTGETWTTVGAMLPGALLSVWGTSASDVWTVGADVGDSVTIRHWDGAAWSTMSHTGTLWWVSGVGGDLWAVGANGAALRIDPSSMTAEEMTLDPTITYFGVWGAAPDDVWAVGGNPDVTADAGTIWHWDGTAWSEAFIPVEGSAAIAVYKVWGTSASDVWAVGTGGLILHYDGTSWATSPGAATTNLFTVAGDGDAVYAVGGEFDGVIERWDGASWSLDTPAGNPLQFNGVHVGVLGPVAVGMQGSVWERGDDGWTTDPRGAATDKDLHAVWTDPDGGIWAVGGHLTSYPQIYGTLIYGGDAPPASL